MPYTLTEEDYAFLLKNATRARRSARRIEKFLGSIDPAEPTPEPPTPEPPPPTTSTLLRRGGNVSAPLRDDDGKLVWYLARRGQDMLSEQARAATEAWEFDHFRVNCYVANGTHWDGTPYSFEGQKQGLLDLRAAYPHITLILDPHPFINRRPTIQDIANLEEFYGWCADNMQDGPAILEGPNEWYAGFMDDVWWSETERMDNLMWDAGWRGPVMHCLPSWGQDIQSAVRPAVVDRLQSTFGPTIWDWHSYGGLRRTGETWARRGMTMAELRELYMPVIEGIIENRLNVHIGEMGFDWNAERQSADGWDYNNMRLSFLLNVEEAPAAGIGMSVWHLHGSSGVSTTFGLKASDQEPFYHEAPFANLSEAGRWFAP